MTQDFQYKTRFLWKDIPVEIMNDPDFFESKTKELIESNFTELKPNFGGSKIKALKTFSVINNESKIELRICYGFNNFKVYRLKKIFDDEAKNTDLSGFKAYRHVEELFRYFKNDDLTLYRAFSGNAYINQYKAIKACVPKQVQYINIVGKVIKDAMKADVSSAFPSQMTKVLPTLHGCKVVKGKVEPSEEYPFAFYTESHHIKIFNELDTRVMNRKWFGTDPVSKEYYYDEIYNNNVKDDYETTILCKASKYSLKEEFEYMYSKRKENSDEKYYMNACIGFFHRNKDPRLSHIASVVIARNNFEMQKRIEKLESENSLILYVATDSIVWSNTYATVKESDVATNEKFMGSFTYEGKNGRFFGRRIGAYQFEDENGTLITKCSYLENNEEKAQLKFGELPMPKGTHKFRITYRDENGIIKTESVM